MLAYYEKTFSKTDFPHETEQSLRDMAKNIELSKRNYLTHKADLEPIILSNYIREV